MRIVCTQENLKAGLTTVSRIISTNNTLPILNNLLLKTENGVLKASSTNLEIAITTNIRCKVEENGETTTNSKTITDLVNNLPNKNIILTTNNNQLFLEAENYHTSIKTLPSEEFPLIPAPEGRVKLNLNAQELKQAIDQVVFAASTNQTQPEISGVLLTQDKEGLRVVATDRYRLAEKKIKINPNTNQTQEVIIPQKTAVEISRIISNQKGVIEMVFSETQIAATLNETQIIGRLVDGQYPDYRQIIPNNFTTSTLTEKTPLVNALRAAAVFSQNNHSIKMEFLANKQELVITTESSELGKSSVELPSKIEGQGGSLLLNYHYLLDCLSGLDSKNVVIKMIDDSSPSLLVPEGDSSYVYLVMPIKN